MTPAHQILASTSQGFYPPQIEMFRKLEPVWYKPSYNPQVRDMELNLDFSVFERAGVSSIFERIRKEANPGLPSLVEALNKIFYYGPKVLSASQSQCELMATGKLSFPLKDYKQPFPLTILKYSDVWSQQASEYNQTPWRLDYTLLSHFPAANIIKLVHYWKDPLRTEFNTRIITSIILPLSPEGTLEENLLHILHNDPLKLDAENQIYWDSIKETGQNATRIALNLCMLATNYSLKGPYHHNEAFYQKALRNAKKNERARQTLRDIPEIYQVDQYLKFQPPANADGSPGDPQYHLRPHFRSGHWKQQPYGPKSSLRKAIFVDWVWVNKQQSDTHPSDVVYVKGE